MHENLTDPTKPKPWRTIGIRMPEGLVVLLAKFAKGNGLNLAEACRLVLAHHVKYEAEK